MTAKENVVFRFFNITLDKVPFCHKTLSMKMHHGTKSYATEPTPVEDFLVKWTSAIEITRAISRDSAGKPMPSILNITVYTHTVKGSGKEEVASGKLDLAQVVRTGKKEMSVALESKILESNLNMEIETQGGDSFTEVSARDASEELPPLPVIVPVLKTSWFNFKHNPDMIEADANRLVEAAVQAAQRRKGSLM